MKLQLRFAQMIARQVGPQQLERRPEPDAVSNGEQQVLQYEKVMQTKLAIAYALALEVLRRVIPAGRAGAALDLACGPAHFSLQLLQELKAESLRGVDLSERMIDSARTTARRLNFESRAMFECGDIRNLSTISTASLDLATFTDAAHHLPSLDDVARVLTEMDRVTKSDGVVFAMDLVRLRTRALTEQYVETLGADYVAQGLPAFLEDFRHSMFAAWTAEEFRSAIPRTTSRVWYHVVARPLPSVQFVVGIPREREPNLKRGSGWTPTTFLAPSLLFEWRMARLSLALARFERLAGPSASRVRINQSQF